MALFDKFKQGLSKTRAFLTGGVSRIGAAMGYFDEEELEALEDLLIQADIGVKTVTEVMEAVRTDIQRRADASTESVLNSLKTQLQERLGASTALRLEPEKLNIILMIGVNGSGKTTTCGKLAARFQADGKRVMLCAADTFRAAAIDQLQAWAQRTQTPCIASHEGADPAAVVYDAVQAAKARHYDVLIIDTAGRLHNKKNLMDELAKLRRIVSREAPEAKVESLLVLDATTGQNAVIQATLFQEVAQLTGFILTKLDGNAKGGVAIAVRQASDCPLYFVGLGEAVDDLQVFDPEAFIQALLPVQGEVQ